MSPLFVYKASCAVTPQPSVCFLSCASIHRLTAQSWFHVCMSCSFWTFYWVSPWNISKTMVMMYHNGSGLNQRRCVPLCAYTGRRWAGHGWRPRVIAGSWSLEKRHVFLSSLREPCLPLAITVCHATVSAMATHSPLMHPSILAIMAQPYLTYSTPQRGNMSSLSPHPPLKRPRSPEGPPLFLCQSICSTLAFIRLLICPPLFWPCHLSPVFNLALCADWGCLNSFVLVISGLCTSQAVRNMNNEYQRF